MTSTPPASAAGLRRAWDGYDAYLFDIDGTLVHCRDAVHYFAFNEVLTAIAGHPVKIDGLPVQGKVDPGILRDAFTRAGVPEARWRPELPAILERMAAHVEAHETGFEITVKPGVPEVLRHLQSRGAALGVGTGNLERIGWAKMRAARLREFFTFGAFSDRHEERGPMISAGVAQARSLTHPEAAVLVIGDTPGDIAAARFAGVEVLAVATGIFPASELVAADRVVASLEALLPTAA